MSGDPAFTWDQRPPVARTRPSAGDEGAPTEPIGERITLREAEHRFGVSVGTLRGWARKGDIDGVMGGSGGRQWMVTAESIAHHLSRKTGTPSPAPRPDATGPTADGSSMLVPRDAWDRLMDQLGNIHEAGLLLAEARERAARAETEAGFLRERLSEMREERDTLKRATPPVDERVGFFRRRRRRKTD